MPDEKKVKFVNLKLKDHALVWWIKFMLNNLENKEKTRSWIRMKEKLKERFLPSDYHQTLCQKFHNLGQYNKSVDEYTEEFYMLLEMI